MIKRVNLTHICVFILMFVSFLYVVPFALAFDADLIKENITVGMEREAFLTVFPKEKARTYRTVDNKEWLSYNFFNDPNKKVITFHLLDKKLVSWAFDDRKEIITEYLSEFCSQAFIHHYTNVYEAIKNALMKVPYDVFLSVTDRERPVLFTEYNYSGVARFAGSSEIITFEDDAPAFMEGMTIIKLSTELNKAEDVQEIEGVILHELAHRVLKHAGSHYVKEFEREANHQVIKWGYKVEYEKASKRFGSSKAFKNTKLPTKGE